MFGKVSGERSVMRELWVSWRIEEGGQVDTGSWGWRSKREGTYGAEEIGLDAERQWHLRSAEDEALYIR